MELAEVQAPSRPHVVNNSGNNEWYTPPQFLEAAREVLGGFDLDPASSDVANEFVKAGTYYTAEADGLSKEWFGRVWLNPPYSRDLLRPFLDKLIEEYESGRVTSAIVLVNNATETGWFQSLAKVANALSLPAKRIKFLDHTGTPKKTPLQGQAFLYLGPEPERFEEVFSRFGFTVVIPDRSLLDSVDPLAMDPLAVDELLDLELDFD